MRPTLFGIVIAASAALAPAWAVGGQKEDAQFANQVAAAIRNSGQVQHYSIGVKYSKGTVYLTGRVTSKQQMVAALQVVSDMPGVKKVVNSLTVGPSKAQDGSNANQGPTRRPRQNNGVQTASANMPMPASRRAHSVDDQNPPPGYTPMNDASVDQGGPSGPGGPAPNGRPLPAYMPGAGGGAYPPAQYDQAQVPNYAWPSYAASPNYAAVTYPKQYSATAWPFIGPFYPYPQVPLGWRKVSLEWHDGWWFLDFKDRGCE